MPQISSLPQVAALLREEKEELLATWRRTVRQMPGAEGLDTPTLNDHIPRFLDEMIGALEQAEFVEPDGLEAPARTPPEHGLQRLEVGFDVREVVAEYNVLRDAVIQLSEEAAVPLAARDLRVINHFIDHSIALAVESYAAEQALELQRRREEHFAFVVHDVRTPLNAISLTTDLLAEEYAGHSPDAEDMIQALRRNVQRIDAIVRQVLQTQRILDSKEKIELYRREIDLWPLVQRLIHDVGPLAESSRTTLRNVVPRHLLLHADAEQTARVFQNLLGNALRFTVSGEIEVGAAMRDGGVECWVRDNGAGIPPERIARIFDKLETDPDPRLAGFGMGLAIVKQIIEAHDGTIDVESEPSRGTVFRFVIPLP